MWDVAGIVCLAQPRPTAYMWLRLDAAAQLPVSAARLNQPAAAGQSGAPTPSPLSRRHPSPNIAFGNPASAPWVTHFTACSYSFLTR